jgi:hypothetical protein
VSTQRDYRKWHQIYDDPESGLSWRLRVVQGYIRQALDRQPGPLRVLSICSGDGRDILGVLSEREDADRVTATLIELDPEIAAAARATASAEALSGVTVRTVDAGSTDVYTDAVPADLVLMVGIFGNISDADLERSIAAAPQFCRPGATLVWSRGRDLNDRNDAVRAWFAQAGFTELDYTTRETGSRPALGAMRYDGAPQPLTPGRQLFSFWR